MNTDNSSSLDSLTALKERQQTIKKQLNYSEKRLGTIWNEIFHSPAAKERNSPTLRAMTLITSYAGVIDGAILGWKLYRKFGKLAKKR